MKLSLDIRNESSRKGIVRRDVLVRLADRVLKAESVTDDVELSVLFCDDLFITGLNRQYRKKNRPTDVLSFAQEDDAPPRGMRILGDVVISLETVERFCEGDKARMKEEVRLLLCHGMLHLLGHDHADAAGKANMKKRQAEYLDIDPDAAWHKDRSRR